MGIPVDITFRGLDPSAAVETLIGDQVAKLERAGRDVVRCHVVVERPGRRARGNPYHITIFLTVPGEDIVVNHQPQIESTLRQEGEEKRLKSTEAGIETQDVQVAVNQAFKRARRRLEDHERRQRGEVKVHEEPPRGLVLRLSADGQYGFIQADDGREIYFHRNSLLNADFGRLAPGVPVSFAEEQGDEGPQASSVRVLS